MLAFDVGDLDDRDVERPTAQIVDRDLAVAFAFVEPERQRSRRRLVDDALDFESGDAAGVLRRLALGIVEVRRDGDHRLGHFLAEIILGGLLHLAQDFGRDLLRRDLLAADLDPGIAVIGLDDLVGHEADVLLHFLFFEAPSDQPLDREDRVLRVRHGLPFCRCTDQHFAVVGVRDDRRRCPSAFRIFDDLRLAAFHDGDAAVGRTEIDSNDFGHDV